MRVLKRVGLFFTLREEPATLGKGISQKSWKWNAALYLGTLAGVLGQFLVQENRWGDSAPPWRHLVEGMVLAGVILPVIYKNAQLSRRPANFMHFFVCLQHGFFWQAIVSTLAP